LWIRPGDTVIVKPWEFDGDTRGDVLLKYTPAEIEWLKRKGFLKDVVDEF
ncbi:translation initiation factor IF-1A, partial [Candidatus Pacearchaeota archaeon]|nr:translation initiation factor IF-1A [Candidatus Pacearchaeota archaeon]